MDDVRLIPGDVAPQQKSGVTLAWQVIPIGIDWRIASWGALFLEGGAGSTGYALAGVKIFFK
jgi:hypothetical protein